MKPCRGRLIPSFLLAFSLLGTPLFARASADALGWASSWTTPQTDAERQRADYRQQLAQARKTGNFKPLLARCDEIVRTHPDDPGAYALRGAVLIGAKQTDRGIADFDRSMQLADKHHNAGQVAGVLFFRAVAFYQAGRYDAAATDLSAAVKANPRLTMGFILLARLRATCPDPMVRDGRGAVELSRRASLLSGRENPLIDDTLAAAYAEAGDFDRAIKFQQDAVRLAQTSKWSATDRQGAAARLALYQHHQAFRQAKSS